MQGNRNTKCDKNECEQSGEYWTAIEMRSKCSSEQGDGCEGNENRTDAHPSLRPTLEKGCETCLHDAGVSGIVEHGLRLALAQYAARDLDAPIPSLLWLDAMPGSAESQYGRGRFYVNEFSAVFSPVNGTNGLQYLYTGEVDIASSCTDNNCKPSLFGRAIATRQRKRSAGREELAFHVELAFHGTAVGRCGMPD